MDLTACPDCGATAQVVDRSVRALQHEPVDHARVRCVHGHWFLLSVDALARAHARLSRAAR